MRIALTVDPEIPVPPLLYGGIERIVEFLVKGLQQRGHEVFLFANRDSKVDSHLIPWPGKKSQSLLDTFFNSTCLTKKLLFTHHFDLVHSFSRLAYLTPILPLKLPKIMSYQREPTISQIRKAKKLDILNTLSFTGCSNYVSDKIRPNASVATIYNGVELEKYDFKSKVSSDAPLVFLGRVENIKGTHVAIEVAQRSGRKLIVAGNIPIEHNQYFEQKIKPHLDDKTITYIGSVNDKQKNELLGTAAALLMPIQWNEPFGIVMAEALACGTPIIGFPKGAVPEVVEHGYNGFVCESIDEMVNTLSKLESIDRSYCRKVAEGKFSSDVIVRQYVELYTAKINGSAT